jgi:O-antigen/teichoic acid export membrane protein
VRSTAPAPAGDAVTSPPRPVLPPRFRRNVVSVYLNIVVSALILLVMTPVLVRGLGKDGYGLWVLLTSLAPYATLLDFGLGSATVKYIGEYYGRDAELTGRTVSTTLSTLTVVGVVVLAAGIPFSFFFPSLFHVQHTQHAAAVVGMLLFTFSGAVSLPGTTFESTLMGTQRYDVTNLTVLAVLAAKGVAWAVIIAMGGSIVELAAATVVLETGGHFILFFAVRRLPDVRFRFLSFDRGLAGRLVGLSAWIALGEASTFVIRQIDPVVVAAVVSVPAAGVYAIGQRLSVGVELLIRPMMTGLLPHASHLSTRDDPALLRAAMLAGTRITLAVAGPICLTVVLLAGPAIHLWVGSGFSSARNVAIFLSTAIAVAAVTRPSVLMLQGIGRARAVVRLVAVEAALNLALSIWLGKTIGLEGVALATLIASTVARFGLMIPFVCRSFEVPIREFVGSIMRAHVPPIAATLGVGWLIERTDLLQIPTLVAAGMALPLAYVATFVVTGLKADERRRLAAMGRHVGASALARIS